MTALTWERPYKPLVGGTPGQPARYAAIVDHLIRDRAKGGLTLKGIDLAYYTAYATPGDDLREWVMARLDERIAAADAERLDGGQQNEPHICGGCRGRGCPSCNMLGFVCPTCRGHRFLADGPIGAQNGKVLPCLDCTAAVGPNRREYDAHREAAAIQRYITLRQHGVAVEREVRI